MELNIVGTIIRQNFVSDSVSKYSRQKTFYTVYCLAIPNHDNGNCAVQHATHGRGTE